MPKSSELARLLRDLAEPAAFPEKVDSVEVIQTAISAVFLAGKIVYKIKKPEQLGFLDFSTLEKRKHFCAEEIRLNRRLAPSVYLGVVPVTIDGDKVRFEGGGEVCEWAVKMTRLPEEATLEKKLARGAIAVEDIIRLGRRVARFHAWAERNERIAAFGSFDVVAGNARENFTQSVPHIGKTVSQKVHDRLRALTEESLTKLRPQLEERARRGVPCDTHGDLHIDHVYLFPERQPPEDLVIVDCIEFNERFRFADPVADMAFLYMDLKYHGRGDLAAVLAEQYFRAGGDDEGRALLPFYASYRAAVRGKVDGFEAAEAEVPADERERATARACGHWLLALGELEEPGRRPCLVLIAGLPGSGKSTLAANLETAANFTVIRSDVVRKELARQEGVAPEPAAFGTGIYTPAWTDKTYRECLRRAQAELFQGRRVLVDANFSEEVWRTRFLDAASTWAVRAVFLECLSAADVVHERLRQRHSDVSDADWQVYQAAAQKWQSPGERTRGFWQTIGTSGSDQEALVEALEKLRRLEVC